MQPPVPAIQPLIQKEFDKEQKKRNGGAGQRGRAVQAHKRELDEFAAKNGLKNKLETEITRRGLVIRLLTDNVLFDSGEAKIKPRALPLLGKIAQLLQVDTQHPINVEGHTDNVPIRIVDLPDELGAVNRSRVERDPLPDRAECAGQADGSGRLRPASPDCVERQRQRAAPATGASRSSFFESTRTLPPEPS